MTRARGARCDRLPPRSPNRRREEYDSALTYHLKQTDASRVYCSQRADGLFGRQKAQVCRAFVTPPRSRGPLGGRQAAQPTRRGASV